METGAASLPSPHHIKERCSPPPLPHHRSPHPAVTPLRSMNSAPPHFSLFYLPIFSPFSVITFKLKCNIKVERRRRDGYSAFDSIKRKKKTVRQTDMRTNNDSLCNVTTCCVIVNGWTSPSGDGSPLGPPRSLRPAYYMYDNVINSSHCYRFIMYFSNLILYVY